MGLKWIAALAMLLPPQCGAQESSHGWTSWSGSCYAVLGTYGRWDDALAACKAHGASLVSIADSDESAVATEVCGDRMCWLGLREKPNTDNIYYWADGSGNLGEWNNWALGQPNNHGGNDEEYVAMNSLRCCCNGGSSSPEVLGDCCSMSGTWNDIDGDLGNWMGGAVHALCEVTECDVTNLANVSGVGQQQTCQSLPSRPSTPVVLAKISGALSIIGSFFILANIAKQWQRMRGTASHLPTPSKIMLNMCIGDIGTSFFVHFLGTWMAPVSWTWIPFAVGTHETCYAQSVMFMFFMQASFWSNVILALTYWLLMVREVPELTLRRPIYKGLILGFPWFVGLFFVIICWENDAVVLFWYCQPEGGSGLRFIAYSILVFGLIAISFFMGSLCWSVYKADTRMDRYLQSGERENREMTIQVAKQGLAYTIAYIMVFLPSFVSLIIYKYWIEIWMSVMFPSQGLLNALVYFRPKYCRERKEGKSVIDAMLATLGVTVPATMSSVISYPGKRFRTANDPVTSVSSPQQTSVTPQSVTLKEEEEGPQEVGDCTTKSNHPGLGEAVDEHNLIAN